MKKIFLLIAAAALALAAIFFLLPHGRPPNSSTPTPSGTGERTGEVTGNEALRLPHPPAPSPERTPDLEISAHDRAQLVTLESVLASHNDNDMRLDTELKVLDAGAKKIFQEKYDQIRAEKRNERGTVVFLLGRNLTQAGDVEFLGKVLAEPPCRSMQSCASDPPHSGDVHGDNAVEVSLAYPQIVALKSLERVLESGSANPLFQQALEKVHRATESPVAIVANLARAIEAKYSRR